MSTITQHRARDLFYVHDRDGHECCSCCTDYCPRTEGAGPPEPFDLYRITIRGRAYISDRYAAIDADRIITDGPDITDVSAATAKKAEDWPHPEHRPPRSTEIFRPPIIRGLITAGYTIHQGNPRNEHGIAQPQPVYDAEEHIGWVMPAHTPEHRRRTTAGWRDVPVIRLDELGRIRDYVHRADHLGWPIPRGDLDAWDAAAAILHELDQLATP